MGAGNQKGDPEGGPRRGTQEGEKEAPFLPPPRARKNNARTPSTPVPTRGGGHQALSPSRVNKPRIAYRRPAIPLRQQGLLETAVRFPVRTATLRNVIVQTDPFGDGSHAGDGRGKEEVDASERERDKERRGIKWPSRKLTMRKLTNFSWTRTPRNATVGLGMLDGPQNRHCPESDSKL